MNIDQLLDLDWGMTTDFANAALDALGNCPDGKARADLAHTQAKRFLDRPDQAAALIMRLVEARDGERIEPALNLLVSVLDEARMAAENGFASGTLLLDATHAALVALADAGALDSARRVMLAQTYAAAGLDTPEPVQLDGEALEEIGDRPLTTDGLPDIDELVDELLQEAGGDPLQAHAQIDQSLAALAVPIRAAMVAQIAADESALRTRLGLYWLLDRAPAVRNAVAEVFRARAEAGTLDAGTAHQLIALRDWLPDEPTRESVDVAIAASVRCEASGVAAPAQWTVHKVVASLPDGASAQSIAAAVRKGGQRGVVMLLLKQGFGVKDAFVVRCASATEQRGMIAAVLEGMAAIEVSSDFVPRALCVALGDGAAAATMPAPGLIDIAEIWNRHTLTPAPADAADLVSFLDEDGTLSALSAQARGRLVSRSGDWCEASPIIGTWFEDNAAVRDIAGTAQSETRVVAELWRYLETRRAWWATMFARAATTLRAAEQASDSSLWMSFAATAQALTAGRALKKTPIMGQILQATREAAAMRSWDDLAALADDEHEPDLAPRPDVPAPRPEKKGELAKFLEETPITPEWMDGFLVAAAVAPVMASPTRWVGTLVNGVDLPDEPALTRYLELVMMRANAASSYAGNASEMGERLSAFGEGARRRWAGGFAAFVATNKRSWPAKLLNADDKRMLKRIGAAAEDGMSVDLALLVPAWLSARNHANKTEF